MEVFKADLHIHTCLSPCGDLEMSPRNIVRQALNKKLHIIAITDHNTTRNARTCIEVGRENNLFVIGGCEINSQEEVHSLAYFPNLEVLDEFQAYIDAHFPDIKNEPSVFGYQVAVDKWDNIIYQEDKALFAALDQSIEDIAQKVHTLGGIFVPAHIDKTKNSIYSQLGFIPFDLEYDALEISWRTDKETFIRSRPELASKRFIFNSDAHYLKDIGKAFTELSMEKLDWESFKKTFQKKER